MGLVVIAVLMVRDIKVGVEDGMRLVCWGLRVFKMLKYDENVIEYSKM